MIHTLTEQTTWQGEMSCCTTLVTDSILLFQCTRVNNKGWKAYEPSLKSVLASSSVTDELKNTSKNTNRPMSRKLRLRLMSTIRSFSNQVKASSLCCLLPGHSESTTFKNYTPIRHFLWPAVTSHTLASSRHWSHIRRRVLAGGTRSRPACRSIIGLRRCLSRANAVDFLRAPATL